MTSPFLNILSIDLRSIAVVRMLVAVILLTDLFDRIPYLTVFLGDAGVLPSHLRTSFWTGEWAWSLHLIDGGSLPVLAVLIFIQIVAAVALLIGYHTRAASIVSWILIVSLHNANPLMLQGGDYLLRALLFVGMFLPWGAVFSRDHARRGYPEVSFQLFSGWSIAYLMQMGFFYFFASMFKTGTEWTTEGSAVYYTLSIDQYATTLGHYLLQFPELLTFITFTVVLFQHFALLLLFSPVFTVWLRTGAALALMCMHFSFAMTMHLGMFSWISIAGLVGFIPGGVWDFLARKTAVGMRFVPRGMGGIITQRMYISLAGLAYVLYIFIWQINYIEPIGRHLPTGWDLPAKVLRIDQYWNLFGPHPFKNDGWYIVAATLENGEQRDLFREGALLNYDRPDNIYATFPSTRWRKYWYELRIPNNEIYRPHFASYMCRSWNDVHKENERVMTLELINMVEFTPPQGAPPNPIRPVTLLQWDCSTGQVLSREEI